MCYVYPVNISDEDYDIMNIYKEDVSIDLAGIRPFPSNTVH